MSVMPKPGVRNVIKNVFDVNLHPDPIKVLVEEDSNAKNIIKNVFDINLHHDPIGVLVEEDSNAKNDGLIAFRGQYSELMGG
jgi:hypothetical protein